MTDGMSWDFHYIRKVKDGFELYKAQRIVANTDKNIKLILGILDFVFFASHALRLLVHFCAGMTPVEDVKAMIKITKTRERV